MELEGELLDKDELLLRELETPEEREERLAAKQQAANLPSAPANKPLTEEEELEAMAAALELA